MLRRIAGWLMGLYPEDRPERTKLACSIGWHRPGELRVRGRYVPVDCVERGCPIVREIRREASTSSGGGS